MADVERPPDCARCGKTLHPAYRFCPECGLPATGATVLSSQIGELREELAIPIVPGRHPLRRLLVPTASAFMVTLVLAVGLLLFNRPLIEVFFPPAEETGKAALEIAPRWEPEWVLLPAGTFHSGPPFRVTDADLNIFPTVAENIAVHHITNGEWLRFLEEDREHLRALGVWDDAVPRFGFGWTRDGNGMPVPPRDPATGAPDLDGYVEDVTVDEIMLYRRFVASSAEYRIAKLGITNERWLSFLRSERDRLIDEGVFESVVPGRSSGWRRDDDGEPALPLARGDEIRATVLDDLSRTFVATLARSVRAARIEDEEARRRALARIVLRAAAGLRGPCGDAVVRGPEFVDRSSLVTGVGVDAVRRYHEWSTRYEVPAPFEISRYEIRNDLWRAFLDQEETDLRARGLWSEAVPGRKGGWVLDAEGRFTPAPGDLDMPVLHVSARAVRAFGDYLTRRLGEPGVEIRAPTPAEWEYAARGDTWNVYPWGDRFPGAPAEGTGEPKTRRGIDENFPLRVDAVDEDTSPLGVVALGVNVAEWVEDFQDDPETGRRRYTRTEIRGASFALGEREAARRARVWDRTLVDPRSAYPYTGVRLVKVHTAPPR